MKRLSHILIAATLLLSACAKPQADQESLAAIENAMRLNVNDPDKLFTELDACIEKYQSVWAKSDLQNHVTDRDKVTQEYEIRAEKIRRHTFNIINLDLEIQDRLIDDPVRLKAYESRVARIGFRP